MGIISAIVCTIFLVLLLIGGILFSKFRFTIDTDASIYHLKIYGLGEASIVSPKMSDKIIAIHWRIWFWKQEYFPENALFTTSGNDKPRKKKRDKKTRKKGKLNWPRIKSVLASFRVHYFVLDLDTNDPVWNSWLFPITYLLNKPQRQLSINYVQHNALRVKVSNRIFNILWAWIFY